MNKVILITGAGRRIGAAIARHCHHCGCNVVIHYRQSQAEAQLLADSLNQRRDNSAVTLQADFNELSSLTPLVDDAYQTWGRLDGLVNNASNFYPTPIAEATTAQWDDLFNGNAKAAFFLSQAAAEYLRDSRGTIINIIDIHGATPLKGYGIYSMAKAALQMQTKVLAKELAPAVRVNGIAPGAIAWPEAQNSLDPAQQQHIIDQTLLKRHGNEQDIAKAVEYFLLHSDYVTGEVLAVDGGRYL
ncbi:MAG: pteridine reductase [Legionellales bacterium]|nr:pteridine reductase [Legionellales bacterium]|tara:strand:+ start:12625 stop:13356 length:732 start_codon:yes stop_codon:yes gene_type:complete